jgi:hypothetical protein
MHSRCSATVRGQSTTQKDKSGVGENGEQKRVTSLINAVPGEVPAGLATVKLFTDLWDKN